MLSKFLIYKRLKLKLSVFLAGHIVALFSNHYVAQLKATSSSMIEQFFGSTILGSTDVEWF